MDGITRGLVAAPVIAARARHADAFASAQPFRHVVIDDFLEADFARQLLAEFPPFEKGNYLAEHGRPGEKSTFERVRALGPAYARLDDLVRSPEFLRLVGEITGLPGLLYDPWYLGGGTHDNRQHAALDPHIDFNFHPLERWHRRLNLIIYLNPEWQPEWGGTLDLYRDPATQDFPDHRVLPLFNRCVVFETNEHSWHGFERITLPPQHETLSRRSVALYFYTPPVASDGPELDAHSTVYVGRRLPAHLQAGHVLDAADMAALHALVAEKDGRIAIQYDEIARLMTLARAHERGVAGSVLYMARKAMAALRHRRQSR